tara:strand:+ start:62212 stop:63240 length:1029 start_codon:yes stop_codon:yes gene_type:complete
MKTNEQLNTYPVNGEGWPKSDDYYRVVYKQENVSSVYFASKGDFISSTETIHENSGVKLEQRYTCQQIKLLQKDERWIVWKYDEKPVALNITVDLHTNCGAVFPSEKSRECIDWENVDAYRLTTNDLYIEGKRIVLGDGDYVDIMSLSENDVQKLCDKATWHQPYSYFVIGTGEAKRELTLAQVLNAENAKSDIQKAAELAIEKINNMTVDELQKEFDKAAGGLVAGAFNHQENDTPEPEYMPKVGEEVTVHNDLDFDMSYGQDVIGSDVEVLSLFNCGGVKVAAVKAHDGAYCFRVEMLRPIQTPRERVIEKAILETDHNWRREDMIAHLYDIGMLKEGVK